MLQTTAVVQQLVGQRAIGVFPPVLHQIIGAAAEVSTEPHIDAGHAQLAISDSHAAWMINIFSGAPIEQSFHVLGGESRRLKIRATEAGAIDRIMHARILPNRAQYAVLDIVEGERFSLDGY